MVTGCTRGLPNKPKLFGKKFGPSSVWTGFRTVLLIYRFPRTQNWTCSPVLQNDRTLDRTLVRFRKVRVQTKVRNQTAASLYSMRRWAWVEDVRDNNTMIFLISTHLCCSVCDWMWGNTAIQMKSGGNIMSPRSDFRSHILLVGRGWWCKNMMKYLR